MTNVPPPDKLIGGRYKVEEASGKKGPDGRWQSSGPFPKYRVQQPYIFVTVVFDAEINFLRLQARSMRLYLPRALISQIIVMENSPMPNGWRKALLEEYGSLRDLVRIIPGSRIAAIPQTAGWFSQQVLKLMISKYLISDCYVILDAKNHLVFPLSRAHLETPSGKLLTFRQHYENHPLRGRLENAARYFGIEPDLKLFPPTTTPFAVPTKMVLDLIRHIEKQEDSFEEFFIRQGMTEFFLLMSYIIKHSHIDDHYDFSGTNYSIIWKETAGDEVRIATEIARTESNLRPFFALHRRSCPLLTPSSRQMIAEFWCRRGLFSTPAAALAIF